MKWITERISKIRAKAAWQDFKLENALELEIINARIQKIQTNIDILKERRTDCSSRNRTEYEGMPLSMILNRIAELEEFKDEYEFDLKNQELVSKTMKQRIYEIYGVKSNE